jgi:DTW domain-containing protein YfiP
VVIEGTWAQARTILNHSPKLQELQAVTLNRPRLSRFQIRSQPKLHCLSTIEAIAYALNDLGEFGDQRAEIFLKPFFSMVDQHINYQKRNRPRFRRTVKTST